MSYLHTVIMAHGLMLLLCVYSRNERISVFQIQMQSKNYFSKCNPDPKNKSCLNQSPITGIRLGLYIIQLRGATSSSFRGGAIFMKFHSMTSSCLFNRGATFSQTVTYNNNVFLPADTKPVVQTHTFCTTLVDKNRQNRTCYNSVGGWITGVKRNFWLHAICACIEQHSTHQIRWENWWLGLRIWFFGVSG